MRLVTRTTWAQFRHAPHESVIVAFVISNIKSRPSQPSLYLIAITRQRSLIALLLASCTDQTTVILNHTESRDSSVLIMIRSPVDCAPDRVATFWCSQDHGWLKSESTLDCIIESAKHNQLLVPNLQIYSRYLTDWLCI